MINVWVWPMFKGGDVVLEIGPGTGSLTNVPVDAGVTVLAIEKDPYMAVLVKERFEGTDKFKDETALRMVEPSWRTSEYRPINIFVNFYSGQFCIQWRTVDVAKITSTHMHTTP